MSKFLTHTALAALVTLGGMAAAPAVQAQGLYLDLDDDNPRVIVRPPSGESRRERREDRRDCTPQRAADKARDMGYRRVQVEEVRRRSIVVSGRRDGRRVDLVFGRDNPRCPLWR